MKRIRFALFVISVVATSTRSLAQTDSLLFSSASLSWSGLSGNVYRHTEEVSPGKDTSFNATIISSCLSALSGAGANSPGCPTTYWDQSQGATLTLSKNTLVLSVTNRYGDSYTLSLALNGDHTLCSQIYYRYGYTAPHGPQGSVEEDYTLNGSFPVQIDSSTGWTCRIHLEDSVLQQSLISISANQAFMSAEYLGNFDGFYEITEKGFDSLVIAPNGTLDVSIGGTMAAVSLPSSNPVSITFLPYSKNEICFELNEAIRASLQIYNILGKLVDSQPVVDGLNTVALPSRTVGMLILRFHITPDFGLPYIISKKLLVE
jgi:hypothetical protein